MIIQLLLQLYINMQEIEEMGRNLLFEDKIPPLYHHHSLAPGRTFRVLRLYGSDDPESMLKFELVDSDLSCPPEYFAISYCWEGQTSTKPAICNNERMYVTVNC